MIINFNDKNFKLLFIFFLLYNFIYNIEVIIPFTSKISKISNNLSPIDFITNLISNELYTNISIGTPPQNLQFILDFNTYHTYIIQEMSKKYERFNYNKSSTFKFVGKKELFQYAAFILGINSSDLITINENATNINYTFLHVIKSTKDTKVEFPGVIGLSVVSNWEPFHEEAGIIYQLKKQNIINNYKYTFVYNNNDFNGKIIIGKNIYDNYPSENFMKDYCLVNHQYAYLWGWNYLESYFNSEKLKIENIYLKPELGVIVVSNRMKDIIKQKFFEEKIKEGKCHEIMSKFSFFYCDKDIKIDIGNFTFVSRKNQIQFYLDSNDLSLEYNNNIYFLMVFDSNIPSLDAHFGYPFFKKFDVIFEQDSRNVGFYNFKINNQKDNNNINNNKIKDNKSKNEQTKQIKNQKNKNNNKINLIKILSVFSIVLFIILSFYFIFYLYRRIKRKENEKIYKEYNYILK